MNAADLLYPTLSVGTSLYALALDDNKRHAPRERKIEPDWTVIEVIIGTAICLIGAAIRARLEEPADWRVHEKIVRRAFEWGSIPIIIWQVWRAYDRQKRRGDTLQHLEKHHANRERSPATLAALRWPRPPANGTNS
jgi:hypothetical protein